jgi:ubiquitin-hydrolase Zn-finger-containing protein
MPTIPVVAPYEFSWSTTVGTIAVMMTPGCSHIDTIVADVAPSSNGCEDCLRIGGHWMHLRRCTACGHVGCCDSSPMKHATAHFHESGHPIVQSFEPGEDWLWCYADDVGFEIESMIPSPAHT